MREHELFELAHQLALPREIGFPQHPVIEFDLTTSPSPDASAERYRACAPA
jgi:hypothetical protein